MKATWHWLVAGCVLALGSVSGAGGGAWAQPPVSGAARCGDIVAQVRCFDALHALCTAIDKAAVPPLAQRDKDAMISVVVGVSTELRQETPNQASQDLNGLQQTLDDLSGAIKTKISNADADKIGAALDAVSLCVDAL